MCELVLVDGGNCGECMMSEYTDEYIDGEPALKEKIRAGTLSGEEIRDMISYFILNQECNTTARYLVSLDPIYIKDIEDAKRQIPAVCPLGDLMKYSKKSKTYCYSVSKYGAYYIAEIFYEG